MATAGNWNTTNLTSAIAAMQSKWFDNSTYREIAKSMTVSQFTNGTYGSKVSGDNEITSDVDYVARMILAEIKNVNPRLNNANAVGRVVANRFKKPAVRPASGTFASIKEVLTQPAQFSATPEKDPASVNPVTGKDAEAGLSKERLFVECVAISLALHSAARNVPEAFSEVGKCRYFHDIDVNSIWSRNADGNPRSTKSDIKSAVYVSSGGWQKITELYTHLGNHIYYDCD